MTLSFVVFYSILLLAILGVAELGICFVDWVLDSAFAKRKKKGRKY